MSDTEAWGIPCLDHTVVVAVVVVVVVLVVVVVVVLVGLTTCDPREHEYGRDETSRIRIRIWLKV